MLRLVHSNLIVVVDEVMLMFLCFAPRCCDILVISIGNLCSDLCWFSLQCQRLCAMWVAVLVFCSCFVLCDVYAFLFLICVVLSCRVAVP